MAGARLPIFIVTGLLVASSVAAHAGDISYVNTFKNVDYLQTANGAAGLAADGAFFSADLITTTSAPYSSAYVTLPSGTNVKLTQNPTFSTDYGFESPTITVSALSTTYTTGTYTFTGLGAGAGNTATLDYTSNDYSKTAPYLTDYSAAQNLNAANSFTFDWGADTPGGNADELDAYVFFTIYNQATGAIVFTDGFAPSSTTSATVAGGTLVAGTAYAYEIDFSNRDSQGGSGAAFDPELGFDTRTDGTFTTQAATVTPEPGGLMLLGTGLMVGVAAMKKRFA